MNHRYFLPIILLFLLMFSELKFSSKTWLPYVFVVVLFAGNFLIYPRHIAQGWDSTLAHTPFYNLEEEMNNYIVESGINLNEIGTAFPLKKKREFLTLKESSIEYQNYDMNRHRYILYSNIMNSYDDLELDNLFKYWTKIKVLKKGRIEVILFEKK